jgi:hypothetical protein
MNAFKLPRYSFALASVLFIALAALASSCRLTQPGSASFASVTVTNHTLNQVLVTTAQVFRDNGYTGTAPTPDSFVFEREGTRGEDIAYGGIVSTQEGSITKVRVNGQIVSLGNNSYRIQCQAYIIRDANSPLPDDPSRLSNMHRGPYQKLLDEAAKRLQ